MIFLTLAAALFCLFAILLWLPVKFDVCYLRKEGKSELKIKALVLAGASSIQVRLSPFNILKFCLILKSKISVYKADSDDGGKKLPFRINLRQLIKAVQLLSRIVKINRRFCKTIRFQRLKWATELGLEDPAVTAAAYGFLWSVKSQIFNVLTNNFQIDFQRPEFSIKPNFLEKKSNTDFQCLFSVRPVVLFLTLTKNIYLIIRTWEKIK